MRLFFLPVILSCFSPAGYGAPLFVDWEGNPLFTERTICGTNDMLEMIGQSEEIQALGHPIGIYQRKTSSGGARCTGTLVSKDLFLTARHCHGGGSSCSNVTVTFGFVDSARQKSFQCDEVVEVGGSSLDEDYMILRLKGNPGVNWGYYSLSDKELPDGTPLMMIHHPKGSPMKLSLEECEVHQTDSRYVRHRCDTESGSSGSAILLRDLEQPQNIRIVGVHTLGGCTSGSSSSNRGPSVRHLATKSALIRSLIQ